MAQGIPPAAAMASYRRSSLPFASLQTLTMLPILRRPVAPSPVAVSPCCSSVAACRLPAQSPTRATPACTTPNFAGQRYPTKSLHARSFRVQACRLPPLQLLNLSAAACGRLRCLCHACCGFKTAVWEPSNAETVRSGPTLCLVGGSRVPFASLQSLKPPTAALHTVLLKL